MKIIRFNEVNSVDPYGEEDWNEEKHIYDVYDSGMEGRDHFHVRYILANSRREANRLAGNLSVWKVENWKEDPRNKEKDKKGFTHLYGTIRIHDEEENYEYEKKKLEKIFNKAKRNLDNFNEIYNEWKKNKNK